MAEQRMVPNECEYSGERQQGKRHGQGSCLYPDGGRYSGRVEGGSLGWLRSSYTGAGAV
ncbi:MAG: hypothetical protein DSY70_00150 [Desulfobulbus sp.]|nr:MAG: hypothetical protein DSY70_00150 [Desulfobulbus sp.]